MPIAHPSDRLNGEYDRRFATRHLVVPLRFRRSDPFEFETSELTPSLPADSVTVYIEMPVRY